MLQSAYTQEVKNGVTYILFDDSNVASTNNQHQPEAADHLENDESVDHAKGKKAGKRDEALELSPEPSLEPDFHDEQEYVDDDDVDVYAGNSD